ncbi:MAG: hypothetical protein K9G67_07430 [Bacteroidales bacterium]|nr:hypothetical protein [Bacteroidales bacterium]MCF8343628.1 hypothetical protein [Bacteroidales bacterium]MCF8350114.1 hypothetical protein [Bacteroidales bacterium]MCF8376172.1 hypothetical protein [Bacteroidales bacterium]MCF8402262.1 hypothetical protein [Bacteroidales bacterium]
MPDKIRRLNYEKIKQILNEYDKESTFEKVNVIPSSEKMHETLESYISVRSFTRKSVLGIDIYRYGLYKHFEQTLIPTVFKILFDKTIRLCLENNQFVFQKYDMKRIEQSFIGTGDGGFLILDTPLHSLFFAINFEILVRAFNAYHLYPKLRNITGSISLRYAITYDTIFSFDNNFYGTAIINNARILEKDTLNRCLIDENAYNWFLINIDGIENLQVLTIHELANILEFQDYDKEIIRTGENEIITTKISRQSGVINSDILKIGQIRSKEISLNIYNLHLQVTIKAFADTNKEIKRTITMSLGNLNTQGI